jgi:hypothetical protein
VLMGTGHNRGAVRRERPSADVELVKWIDRERSFAIRTNAGARESLESEDRQEPDAHSYDFR